MPQPLENGAFVLAREPIVLPNDAQIDNIQRYEAHLTRQIGKDLEMFRALQKRRETD